MHNEKYLTEKEIQKDEGKNLHEISVEFKKGFDLIKDYEKSVTFFGSARFTGDNIYSKSAETLAERIVKELKYAVITGGGPGIMEGANRGAKKASGDSIGVSIELPQEQKTNIYVNREESFRYFFVRKTILTFAAEAYIFFPGGFGTFDEFFDVLTLIQTKKIPAVPIILMGKDFWNPLNEYIESKLLNEHHTIDAKDMELYKITDSHDEAIEIIKSAPISRWWKNFEK